MLASVDWQTIVTNVVALLGAITAIGVAFNWVFGPRALAWVRRNVAEFLHPIKQEITDLKELNTEEHARTGARFDHLEDKIDDRWRSHEEKHTEIQRSLGRIEGRQAAIHPLPDSDVG